VGEEGRSETDPSPFASIGFSGKAPASETEGNKRERNQCKQAFRLQVLRAN
jgi:hypothetical protein